LKKEGTYRYVKAKPQGVWQVVRKEKVPGLKKIRPKGERKPENRRETGGVRGRGFLGASLEGKREKRRGKGKPIKES